MGDPLTSGWFWGRMEVFRGSGAVVAQLLPKQWVAGSNPVSRSNSLQAKPGGLFFGLPQSNCCMRQSESAPIIEWRGSLTDGHLCTHMANLALLTLMRAST